MPREVTCQCEAAAHGDDGCKAKAKKTVHTLYGAFQVCDACTGCMTTAQRDPDAVDPEATAAMRQRSIPSDVWYAYQNEDMGHADLGRLTFLVVGPGRTFTSPPQQAPDSSAIGFGWRYRLVGTVDLGTGRVVRTSKIVGDAQHGAT